MDICHTELFKEILSDIMYSFRNAVIRLTDTNVDIKLTKIRTTPIIIDKNKTHQLTGTIQDLVGGHIQCILDDTFVNFMIQHINHEIEQEFIIDMFMEYVFDLFSHTAKNNKLQIELDNNIDTEWNNNIYYIQYNVKVIKDNEIISTKLIIGVDELTSLYFEN